MAFTEEKEGVDRKNKTTRAMLVCKVCFQRFAPYAHIGVLWHMHLRLGLRSTDLAGLPHSLDEIVLFEIPLCGAPAE